jgi:hypothetical protein
MRKDLLKKEKRELQELPLIEDDEDDEDNPDSSVLSKAQPTQPLDASSKLSSSGQSLSLSDRESGHDSSICLSLGGDFSSSLTLQETKNSDDSSSVRESLNAQKSSQEDKRPELARLNDSSISASLGGDDYLSEQLPEKKPSVRWAEESYSELPEEKPSVRWEASHSINIIERLSHSSMDRMFYTEEELADQRHEAWCEECGLDPSDFQ